MERGFEDRKFMVTGAGTGFGDMASGQASWTVVTEEAIDHVLAVDITGTMIADGGYSMLGA
ncbi:MAG TPA: hypothetical protein VG371_02990 [Solirubrobacteraceae bacterium]|jgi:hypothetical protein|nr:hypothetical protein [Solirubrobacteraceae bacterium]